MGLGGGEFRSIPKASFVAELAREAKRLGLRDVTIADLIRLGDHGIV